ncbi:hypothetical protein CISIN_1g0449502mg, partial [Citrus sinensis]
YVGETKRTTSQLQAHSLNVPVQSDRAPSLCIAARGATGEQARRKILPALFALYYSGFLPEANVGIVGYSRKNLTDEDLRSMIASTLSCRIDHCNFILGQYKATSGDKVDVKLNSLTPMYFVVVLYIDNASWDGVPFLIKTGMGLIRH